MMQTWIVAMIVGYAAWVVLRRYTPAPARKAARAWTARAARRLGWRRMAVRFELEKSAAAACGNGCGSCGGCGVPRAARPDQ